MAVYCDFTIPGNAKIVEDAVRMALKEEGFYEKVRAIFVQSLCNCRAQYVHTVVRVSLGDVKDIFDIDRILNVMSFNRHLQQFANMYFAETGCTLAIHFSDVVFTVLNEVSTMLTEDTKNSQEARCSYVLRYAVEQYGRVARLKFKHTVYNVRNKAGVTCKCTAFEASGISDPPLKDLFEWFNSFTRVMMVEDLVACVENACFVLTPAAMAKKFVLGRIL